MGKKSKSKKVNQDERIVFKEYFIQKEFDKVIKKILNSELDEGLYIFIKMNFCIEMVEDFSEYGDGLIDLDFTDYFTGDKCFLCFIKFDFDEFIDMIYEFYNSKLND